MIKNYLARTLFCGFLYIGLSFPAQAEGWFLGGGIVDVSFEDDLSDIDSGYGLTFSGGYQYDDLLSAEILSSFSYHDEPGFDDDVLHISIMGGAKFSVGGGKFRPYGVVGISLNVIEFGDFDDLDDDDDFDDFDEIDGIGVYFGFGADILVARQHAINIGYRSNRWNGTGDGRDLDVRADMFSVAYNFYLGDQG